MVVEVGGRYILTNIMCLCCGCIVVSAARKYPCSALGVGKRRMWPRNSGDIPMYTPPFAVPHLSFWPIALWYPLIGLGRGWPASVLVCFSIRFSAFVFSV